MRNCSCNNCNSRSYSSSNSTNLNNTSNINSSSNIYNTNFSQSGAFPSNYLYGHAYTPTQTMCRTYTPEIGLQNGSIFPELVSPYSPGQSMDFIEYLRNGGI